MTAVEGTPELVWYVMRGGGLVAFVLLSVTVAMGVVGVARWQSPRWPRLVTAGLHRNVSLLAVCFVALHVITAVVDSWVGLGWLGVVVPFLSRYRPLWLGLGVVAFDLLVAVTATSLLRRRLGYRRWRLVHGGTWLLWPLALVHALGSGTDRDTPWALGIGVGCVVLVAAALVCRLHRAPAPGASRPRTRGSTVPSSTGAGTVDPSLSWGADPAVEPYGR